MAWLASIYLSSLTVRFYRTDTPFLVWPQKTLRWWRLSGSQRLRTSSGSISLDAVSSLSFCLCSWSWHTQKFQQIQTSRVHYIFQPVSCEIKRFLVPFPSSDNCCIADQGHKGCWSLPQWPLSKTQEDTLDKLPVHHRAHTFTGYFIRACFGTGT